MKAEDKLLALQKLASDILLIDANVLGLHAVFEGFLLDKFPEENVTMVMDDVLKKISVIAIELNVVMKVMEEVVIDNNKKGVGKKDVRKRRNRSQDNS